MPVFSRGSQRSRVLQQLLQHGAMPRHEIAKRIGLGQAAVSRISRELIDSGVLIETEERRTTGRPGRPGVVLDLAPGGFFVLGLRLEAYAPAMVLAGSGGGIIARRALDNLPTKGGEAAIEVIAAHARQLVAETRTRPERLLGMGVVSVGKVDAASGTLVESVALNWRNVNLTENLSDALGIPVAVENIQDAIARAETEFGVAHDLRDFVLIRVNLALGATMVFAGRHMHRGGSFGHIEVDSASEWCACGRRGCLEAVAGGRAVLRALGRAGPKMVGAERFSEEAERLNAVLAEAEAGNPAVVQAIEHAGRSLGSTLAPIIGLLAPQAIALSGALGTQRAFMGMVEQAVVAHAERLAQPPPRVLASTMEGEEAAVRLALLEFALSPGLDLDRFLGVQTARRRSAADAGVHDDRELVS